MPITITLYFKDGKAKTFKDVDFFTTEDDVVQINKLKQQGE